MKKIAVLAIGLAIACNSSQKTASTTNEIAPVEQTPEAFAETITEADLKEHLYIYASDDFEGRETGSPGQKKAAEYLKEHYIDLGIPPAQEDGNYFQKVPLEVSQLPSGSITIKGKNYPLGTDFLTFSGGKGEFDHIVYAGYGIETEGYSDYKDIDVAGKIVLVKSGEPLTKTATIPFRAPPKNRYGAICRNPWENVWSSHRAREPRECSITTRPTSPVLKVGSIG